MKHLTYGQIRLLERLSQEQLIWRREAGNWQLGATELTYASRDVLQLLSMGLVGTQGVDAMGVNDAYTKLVITAAGEAQLRAAITTNAG